MSGTQDQKAKAGLIEEFDLFLCESGESPFYSLNEKSSARLRSIADAKTADAKLFYAPACLELYLRQHELFLEEGRAARVDPAVLTEKQEALGKLYLDRAFAAGYAPAQFLKAMDSAEVKEKENLLKQAADQKYAPAQFALASLLEQKIQGGDKAPATFTRMISLLKLSAQAGNLDALDKLGDIYSEVGARANPSLAAGFYLEAARKGHEGSIRTLSLLANQHKAYYQALKQLAKEGYIEACYLLGKVYQESGEQPVSELDVDDQVGPKENTPESELAALVSADKQAGETAVKWYEKAAAQGHRGALKALSRGDEYKHGGNVPYRVIPDDQNVSSAPPQPLLEKWSRASWVKRYDYAWRNKCYNPSFLGLRASAVGRTWSLLEAFEYALEQDQAMLLSLVSETEQKTAYAPACFELYQRRSQLDFHLDEDPETLASSYLEKALAAGYAPAQFLKAMDRDRAEVEEKENLLRQAADQKYAPAQLSLAELLLERLVEEFSLNVEEEGDEEQAAPVPDHSTIPEKITAITDLLESAKQAGSLSAVTQLAQIYSGHAFRRVSNEVFEEQINHKKAVAYYLEAARQGHLKSIQSLGELVNSQACGYHQGGVAETDAYYKALKQLAEEGYIEAQYQLAEIYNVVESLSKPQTRTQDYQLLSVGKETAAKWYQKAAAQGHYSARARLDEFKPKDVSSSISESESGYGHPPVPYRVIPDDQKASPPQPLLTEWDEAVWLRACYYDWRKKYNSELSKRSGTGIQIQMMPDVDSSVFAGLSVLGSDSAFDEAEEENESQGAGVRPLEGFDSDLEPLVYHEFSARGLVAAFIIGTGLGILALYFSGSLVTLSALGLGAIAPFFLAAALGGFLALTLAASLQLSFKVQRKDLLNALFVLAPLSFSGLALVLAITVFASTGLVPLVIAGLAGAGAGFLLALLVRWINPISSGSGGFKRARAGSDVSGIDLEARGLERRPSVVGPPTADRSPVGGKGDGGHEPDSATTFTPTRTSDEG